MSLSKINGSYAHFFREDNIIRLEATPLVSVRGVAVYPKGVSKYPIGFEETGYLGPSNVISATAIYASYAELLKRYEIINGLVPDDYQDYTKWRFIKPFRLDGRGGLDVPIMSQCEVRCKEVKTAYAVGIPNFDGTFSPPFLGSEYIDGWDDSANVATNLRNGISIPVRFEIGDSTEYSTYNAEPVESSDWEDGATEVTTHPSYRFSAASFFLQSVSLAIEDVFTIDGRRVRLKRTISKGTTSKSRVDLPTVIF